MSGKHLPLRSEVPVVATWDLDSIFATPEDWEHAYVEIEKALPKLKDFTGKLSQGPEVLADFFREKERVEKLVGKLLVYAHGFAAVDMSNQVYTGNRDKAYSLYTQVNTATSFAESELLSIGIDDLFDWTLKNSDLEQNKFYFEKLGRRSDHIRSSEIEHLLTSVLDPFRTAAGTHGILANTDLKIPAIPDPEGGDAIELAHSNYRKYWRHPNRELRKTAWETYADAHLRYKNTIANALAAGVKQQVFLSRARNYQSALHAALEANFIPLNVYQTLIDTFKKNLPTWHRYWDIRKKALGLEQMHIYDTRVMLSKNPPQVSFEQACDWIEAGMAPMGKEYLEIMQRGLHKDRWVDHAVNKGKRFGAFSMGVQGTHPYIMMSFVNDIFGVSTLAHELGHSLHSYYTNDNQPWIYTDYSLFVAEVASNFNQALVRSHLLDTFEDRDLQIAIIEEAMNNFHRYFFTMPTLARFELEIHQSVERGDPITADSLIDLMADLYTEGYGPGLVIDRERIGSVWLQFSTHLYSNFYVFQYATGISGANALAQQVLAEGEPARHRYQEFLKAGDSLYPLDALKLGGVDLSVPDPIEKTFEVMSGYINRLEELVQ